MKKSFKYMFVLFITMICGVLNVSANTYTVKSKTITCTFNIVDSTQKNNTGKCVDVTGDEYNLQNFDSECGMDICNNFLHGYRALNSLTKGEAPKYFVIGHSTKNIVFVNTDTVEYNNNYDINSKLTVKEFAKLIFEEAGQAWTDPSYDVQQATLTITVKDNSCKNEIITQYNKLKIAIKNVTSNSTMCTSMAYDYCDEHYENLKNEIEESKKVYEKYKNGECADYNDLTVFKSDIDNYSKDYDTYMSLPKQTITKSTTEKAKNSSTGIQYVGENICKDNNVLATLKVIGIFLLIAKIFVPIIIIAVGSLDLLKAVQKGDSSEIVKSGKTFGIRLAIGLLIFFIPSIVYAILAGVNNFSQIQDEYNGCAMCLLKPTKCDAKTVDLENCGYNGCE